MMATNMELKINLRNKIAQMFIIGFDGKTINSQSKIVKQIEKYSIGGVILFDYNFQTQKFDKNIANPTQLKKLNCDLQYYNHQSNIKYHRPNLPLFIAVDYEGGNVNRLGEQYGFPKTISAAEVGKKTLAEAELIAATMAQTLKNMEFNLNFAPVLDVNINPQNPIIGKKNRSYSSIASKVTDYARIYAHNFLNKNIQYAYKHFPGHGSATGDSHLGFVDVTDTWQDYELVPYRQLLNQDVACSMIMTAHIVNRRLDSSGLPATLSYKILTELLRNQLHFSGVIITDDMQMKAISDNYALDKALILAINAGADMFIFGNNLYTKDDIEDLINIIADGVLAGVISHEKINQAYQHIIACKQATIT